jgi:hemoglobin
MKNSLHRCRLIASLSALLCWGSVSAQSMPEPPSLYQSLGERAGLVQLMDNFVPRLLANARIAAFFKDTNLTQLKSQLADQVCQVAGGPCQYKGADMKTVHAEMDVGASHFNALVEDLQAAMDAQGIPFRVQNRLLALLAPMHRDIVAPP